MQFEKPCPRLKVFHPGSMSGFQKGFFMIEIVMVLVMVVMRVVGIKKQTGLPHRWFEKTCSRGSVGGRQT